MPYLAGYVTPQDYGATGNGTTDDTAAVQAAITAVQTAGGGTVFFPAGTYLCTPTTSPALSITANNVKLMGPSRGGATIKKNGAGVLLGISGPSSDPTGATHVRYTTVENLKFHGNSQTGAVIQMYYNDNSTLRDVYIVNNADICVDCVEFWDSAFYNCVIESSTGAANASAPNTYLRNSAAASGFGASTDNCNDIKFIGCRWENFGTGALWIVQGTGNSNTPNNIYINDCKMETSSMQGGPHLKADATCAAVWVNGLYCYAGGFAGGYSTAQNIIVWSAQVGGLENVLISNGAVATINSGVDLFSGASSVAYLKNVFGGYTTAPTGAHVYFEGSSSADFMLENVWSKAGAQTGGTVQTKWFQNSPLRQIAGPVSDGSFTRTPMNGTTALDTTNLNFYVRIGGSWYSVPVNATAGYVTASGNLLVGASSSLGDNGVGEIQLHNATTPPTTNPTAGAVVYARNGGLITRDPNGTLSPLVSDPGGQGATTGAISETVPRIMVTTSAAPVSGTLYLQSTFIPAGVSIGHIGFATGTTAASGPTHWWVALLDNTYKQQAHSADQLTAAIGASTWFNLAMASPFVTTYTGTYYLALLVATSTTQPTILQSSSTPAAQFWTGTGAPTPLPNGASTASLTAPGTDGTTTYAAPTIASAPFYLYCSA
jgi:hypothetical protein